VRPACETAKSNPGQGAVHVVVLQVVVPLRLGLDVGVGEQEREAVAERPLQPQLQRLGSGPRRSSVPVWMMSPYWG